MQYAFLAVVLVGFAIGLRVIMGMEYYFKASEKSIETSRNPSKRPTLNWIIVTGARRGEEIKIAITNGDESRLHDAGETSLLHRIECEWRPWMGIDDDWMYPEETGQPPQRPDPYPSTARLGKFLISE